jgi:hypothetical protein
MENEEEEKKKEEIIKQSQHGDPSKSAEVPLSNENFVPVSDGNIPLNSEGIISGQFDSLEGNGIQQISFNQGNYNQVLGYPQLIQDKVGSLTQTLVPLIEIALIELLGNNQLYQRESGQCNLTFQNNQIFLSFAFIYKVANFIGTDIETEAIAHDSNYILNRLRPTKANITKCEISTESGTVTIMGSI